MSIRCSGSKEPTLVSIIVNTPLRVREAGASRPGLA
jgi:hypothetical protein